MSHCIAGLGWATPLGSGLDEVWELIREQRVPEVKTLAHPETGRTFSTYAVPPERIAHLNRNPRLRRSSTISYLAVAAGLAALEHAGGETRATAIVFAIGDGGVAYTRRFYEQIVKQGANTASPLLFPETVYNAPASHLAAQLGIDGASYTLVGDASVGLAALHFAGELLDTSDVEQVVVVGAEELDWILCDAYQTWHFARTPLAEGAAAVLLRRAGRWRLRTHPGVPFFDQREAASALDRAVAHFDSADLIVASGNGTFAERAEREILARRFPGVRTLFPKRSLGEAPGASALIQTVLAAQAVEKGAASRALVSVVGLNQQASAALVG